MILKTEKMLVMAGLLAAWMLSVQGSANDIHNLVANPGFETIDEARKMPAGWRQGLPREEIAPAFAVDSMPTQSGKYALRLSSRGSPGTYGYWATTVKGINGSEMAVQKRPGAINTFGGKDFLSNQSYRFRCYFKPGEVESVAKNISMKIRWKDEKGQEILGEFIWHYRQEGDWYKADQVLTAPRNASSADIELILQWTAHGSVWWTGVSFEETGRPLEKKIKVATVSYEPPRPSTPEKNRQFFAEKVAAAGKAGADIICLGEGITLVSTGKKYSEVAEGIPGPTSQLLGEAAKSSRIYIVAGIYERDGNLIYNTALLIGREGEVVGKYRKTHLPETEVSGGLTPGDKYPVFQVDFGVIGLQICYDNFFPEVARNLALQGAEVIFLPIWGDIRGEDYQWDIVARSRAIDNAVYFVASNYSNKRSLIIDPNGRILADTKGKSGTVIAEVDLSARTFERWLSFGGFGEWKNLYPSERRGETYSPLLGVRTAGNSQRDK